jgi:hypothetical protein
MPGYSNTPLVKKLGIKPRSRLFVSSAPANYRALVAPLPEGAHIVSRLDELVDIIHAFATTRRELRDFLRRARRTMRADASIWISWPKRASKVPTDITEDAIRAVALPIGLVDIKVCAVDDVWSGLKLVIRKELR